MSEEAHWHRFGQGGRLRWVLLPHDAKALLADWGRLRSTMARGAAPHFERHEWAYLMTFVEPAALLAVFEEELGVFDAEDPGESKSLAPIFGRGVRVLRPRTPWAVWLPSNVSLLGPLLVAMASLTGAAVHLKAGSDGGDLAGSFVAWAREHAGEGPLGRWLREHVSVEKFDRADVRNRELAAKAAVRIAFGSETSVTAIDALPHQTTSPFLAFGDRVSQAFIEPAMARDASVADVLIRTFAIYGSAGCTSPRRVVLLDGTDSDATLLRDTLVARWSSAVRRDPAMAAASQNFATLQLARAAGWDARLAPRSAAVVSAGTPGLETVNGTGHLEIVTADLEQAVAHLPANVQTVGLACTPARTARVMQRLSSTPVQRVVPLAHMHHFGGVWDGLPIVASLFEHVSMAG